MPTRLHIHGTENIVHPSQFHGFPIDGSRPSRIVDLREHQHTALSGVDVVSQAVRFIASDSDHTGCILFDGIPQLRLKLRVGNSLMTQVQTPHGIHLLIGIVHISELVYEPGIAKDVRVLDGNGLPAFQGEDEIFGVEHIQYWEDTVTLYQSHVTASLRNSPEQLLHLRIDITFHKFLITAQLGCMVSADALMIVAGLVLIEGVRREVQHTVVEALVTQDQLIGLRLLLRSFTLRLRHKHLVVQISLIDLPQVEETEQEDGADGISLLQLSIPVEQQQSCADDNDPE